MSDSAESSTTIFSPTEIRSILSGLMLIILLGALDQTIVSVSLPQMANELGGTATLAWVVSGYLVAATVSTPVYGKLGDLYGRRLLLSVAVAIFLVASVACAMAQSMPILIAARILQGVGGGGLISTAQAIIGEVAPLHERGRYQGYISVVYATASVGGPILGGYLTHWLSWRWIFWINLPLGLVAIWSARRALKRLPVPGVRLPIDYVGAILLTTGLSMLLIAITQVGQGIALASSRTLGMIAGAGLLLAWFIHHERRAVEPLIPLTILKIRAVWIGCAILFISFFQVVALSTLVPFGMQTLDGLGADQAALQLIAFSLAIPIGAFVSGRWMMHSGRYRPIQMIGTALLPLASLTLAIIGPHPTLATGAALAAAGIGIGMTLPTSLVAVQNAVARRYIGIATAMTALFRSMGGAIGVAVLSAILFAIIGNHGIGHGGLSELGLHPSTTVLPSVAERAFRISFFCGAAVALLAHGLAWMIPEAPLRVTQVKASNDVTSSGNNAGS